MTIPNQRPNRTGIRLVAAGICLAMAGCSATGTGRLGGISRSGQRTVASVGDHPISARGSNPEAASTDADRADTPRRSLLGKRDGSTSRISGRVVDSNGDPVADVSVRLADGTVTGGKDPVTATDQAGGFTLTGLRPNADYTLIAETNGRSEPLRGTVEAQSSATGVEIQLTALDERRATSRPSRAVPISNRSSGAADDPVPVAEAESVTEARPARVRTAGSRKAWHRTGVAAEASDIEPLPDDLGPDDEGPNPLPPAMERSAQPNPVSQREPDSEPGQMALAQAPVRSAPADDATAVAPTTPDDLTPPLEAHPSVAATNAAALPSLTDAVTAPIPEKDPTPAPVPTGPSVAAATPAAPELAPATPTPPAGSDYNPFADPFVTQTAPTARPTASPAIRPRVAAGAMTSAFGPEIAPRSGPPAEKISGIAAAPALLAQGDLIPSRATPSPGVAPVPVRKRTWGDLPKTAAPTSNEATPLLAETDRGEGPAVGKVPAESPALAATPSRSRAKTDRAGAKRPPVSVCQFDARQGKINDFQLPDLEGNVVGLKDLDSELIVLDFWGTWCKPCVEAVPHLVELQKKFGPGRLAVVGIACESDPPAEQKAKVEAAARRLGINYTVLMSGMDGPCPLRSALHVQNLPTMIVLDRSGKIRWRGEGATPATLDRLDRVIAAATSARAQTARR